MPHPLNTPDGAAIIAFRCTSGGDQSKRESARCGRVAHRAARKPRRHARVLRFRHLRGLRRRYCQRNLPQYLTARLADRIFRRLCDRLSCTSDRRRRAEPLRRSFRTPPRVLWSLFVMSGATLGMGLVPSYAQWGIAASALMVILRLIQGFCLGGELPGALTYVVETTPRLAPLVCSVVFACVTAGSGGCDSHEPCRSYTCFLRSRPVLRLARGFRAWRPRGRAELHAAPVARRVAGVRTNAGPGSTTAISRAAAHPCGASNRRMRRLAGTACFTGLFFSHLPAYLAAVLKYDPREAVRGQTIAVLAHAAGILAGGLDRRSVSLRDICCGRAWS